ncbi:MAG: hypothetical protein ACI8ZX_002482 [Planctomycetota bacterium]
MNIKYTHFLISVAILSYTSRVYSQDLKLEFNSNKKTENIFLSKINYETKHKDSTALFDEINKVQKIIKLNGYFLSSIDSVLQKNKKYTVYMNFQEKVDSVYLKYTNAPTLFLKKYNFKDNQIKLPINQLKQILTEISTQQEIKGAAFSKVQLQNFKIKNKTLFAEIHFTSSKKRTVDKVIFKGYEKFPKSFVQNYFNIHSKTTFNKKKLTEISKLSKALNFASEIKAPETLFTKDSTFVYVYLKKTKGSSFDGLVNFASQETGKLQFNGYLDLKLKNILNKGESFNLLWNRFGNERQEFSIAAKTPFIFNSKFSTELSFSIYKQDTTFLSTRLQTSLKYQIKNNTNLFATFLSENSENTATTIQNNIKTYKNYFIGFGYEYKLPKNDVSRNDTFYVNINPSFGKRSTTNNSFSQIKITTTISYLLDLNKKASFYLRNKTGLLESENYFDNELLRIGGNNSIRGFNEQSIFVKNYILQNIEYRYTTSADSYLYTITDLAIISTNQNKEKLYSLGIGYLFNTNNSQINISTAIGSNSKNSLDFKNTQFFVNWINFF